LLSCFAFILALEHSVRFSSHPADAPGYTKRMSFLARGGAEPITTPPD
jgi:hypothetical protein